MHVVDPRRSRNIAKELSVLSGYGRAKTDRIDGEMLAEQTRRGLAPTIHVPTAEQLEMRTICRQRFMSVNDRTRSKNMIHSMFAMHGVSVKIDVLLNQPQVKAQLMQLLPKYVPFIIEQLLARIRLCDREIDIYTAELDRQLDKSFSVPWNSI